MHPATKLQFKRVVDEYGRWRALAEAERPPAPAWWWAPAIEVREIDLPLPAEWCPRLGLPVGATYRAASAMIFGLMAPQTYLPWPYDFSRKIASTDSDVRDLHVQPTDDSAFQA